MATFKHYFFRSVLACVAIFVVSCTAHKDRKKTSFEEWRSSDQTVHVLATTAVIEDLVKRVGKEHVATISMITGDANPHAYEIVKGDDEKFKRADLVISNGLQLEHSASMQHQLAVHKKVVLLGDEIFKKAPEKRIVIDGQVDPHIWMDVSLWSLGVEPVVEALIEIDPEHAEAYRENAKVAEAEFLKKDKEIFEKLQAIPSEKRYLVTTHDAFNYHARRYLKDPKESEWRSRVKALQGLAPDEQISALEIQEIVSFVTTFDIVAIFPEANLSKDSLEKVKEGCLHRGKQIVLPEETLYGDTLGGKSYFEMLDHNVSLMCKHLR